MLKFSKTFNLGQFAINVSSNNDKFLVDFSNYLHSAKDKNFEDVLSLNIEDNPERLSNIIEILDANKCSFVEGYMKTPLKNCETEDLLINYDEKHNVVILKNKNDNSIDIVLDSKTSSKYGSIPMYIAREMIIRKNENLGNIILHSASVFYDDKAYAIVGGPGAGKTSLLLGLLKGNDSKVGYVSNDINFVTPDLQQMYPFQIPMLLSDATADSYFKDKKSEIMGDTSTISYFHQKDQEMITKFKIDRRSVEKLFNVNSLSEATFGGIIIPRFQKSKKGFDVQIVDKNFAKELIDGQVLDGDDRFANDYLGLSTGNYKKSDYVLDPIVDSTPIVCVTYGKDIFEKENTEGIHNIFKFLRRTTIKNFELHCHTTASDGRLTAEELVEKSLRNGVDTLAITDHNTMKGYLEAREYIESNNIPGLDLIPGVELDVNDYSCLHVLGYGIQDVAQMEDFLNNLAKQNETVYLKIIDNLSKLGVDISAEKVLSTFGADKLTKQLIGNYLIENNYALNTTEVTQKYLGQHCPSYVPRVQPTIEECINMIHQCGGISVLAHPMELMKYNRSLNEENKVYNFIKELKGIGLDGVECCTYKHTHKQEGDLLELCDHLGLVKTIGNDYHGKSLQAFGTDEINIIEEFKVALCQLENDM